MADQRDDKLPPLERDPVIEPSKQFVDRSLRRAKKVEDQSGDDSSRS